MTNELLNLNPYSLNKKKKNNFFLYHIKKLTYYHYKKCAVYKKIIKNLKFKINKKSKLEDFPMLPARIFKQHALSSIDKGAIVKTLVSSGTSGKNLSKIYLDKKNAGDQLKVLKKIVEEILGKERLPMLIIDQNPKLLNRSIFNARAAAIFGFSFFGKDHCYLLDNKNNINYNALNNFLKKYGNNKFFIFGFTSIIYHELIKKLSFKLINSNFKNGILLHGGGWKKLQKLKISNKSFKKKLFNKVGLKKIYNYYGMVEQTGSIFIECIKCNCFVTSVFSDVLIRNKNFELIGEKQKGLIQLLSLLPTSYPGHNILTEDVGEIIIKNNCECEKKGKRFLVHGRAKEAETRGCSDVR